MSERSHQDWRILDGRGPRSGSGSPRHVPDRAGFSRWRGPLRQIVRRRKATVNRTMQTSWMTSAFIVDDFRLVHCVPRSAWLGRTLWVSMGEQIDPIVAAARLRGLEDSSRPGARSGHRRVPHLLRRLCICGPDGAPILGSSGRRLRSAVAAPSIQPGLGDIRPMGDTGPIALVR